MEIFLFSLYLHYQHHQFSCVFDLETATVGFQEEDVLILMGLFISAKQKQTQIVTKGHFHALSAFKCASYLKLSLLK